MKKMRLIGLITKYNHRLQWGLSHTGAGRCAKKKYQDYLNVVFY